MDTEKNTHIGFNSVPIRIGEWTFHPDVFKLIRVGQEVKLEPRSAQLLMYLAQNSGKTCSRELLIENAWPNMVVGDEALTSAINKLRKAFKDNSHNPKLIETIPKAGYRLIAPVEFLSNDKNSAETVPNTNSILKNNHQTSWMGIISIALLAMVASIFWVLFNQGNKEPALVVAQVPIADKPSIAVLPFENISKDTDQEYFVDGITEDIITDLSRISNLRVLARNTTFRYKGQPLDLLQIAKDLNVNHVLEGSVRKSGKQLRISARLINTENGQNVWAERYDRTLDGIFEVQDNVTRNIVSALSIHLSDQEKKAYEIPTTNSFEAYDLFLKGRNQLNQRTKESNRQAKDYFLQAIALDPNFARAYGSMAVLLTRSFTASFSDEDPQKIKDKALFYALKAVELNDKSQNTYWALGFTHLYRKEIPQAEQAVTKALKIAPNYADGLALLALIKNHIGEAETSIKLINKAMLLNPDYTWDYLYNLGWGYYTLKQYDQAGAYLSEALERNENTRVARLLLAANYIALGLKEDAQWEIEELLMQSPSYSISKVANDRPILNKEYMDSYLSHLRQAGLPE